MARHRFDRTDRLILETLQDDGRIANVELAEKISLSPSPCLRRTRSLEQDGVIVGYRAELDRTAAGLGLTVFLELRAQGHSRETSARTEAALRKLPPVVACYLISGASDFLVEVVVPDLAAYERFLLDDVLTIDTIVDARSTFVIRTVASRRPLPLRHLGRG